MDKTKELKKEIETLRKKIITIEDDIQNLKKNINYNSDIIKATNNDVNKLMQKSIISDEKGKVVLEKNKKKDKKDQEGYDWIEDTIEFD